MEFTRPLSGITRITKNNTMVRDYELYRGPNYGMPPYDMVIHKLVTCDHCGVTIACCLPTDLPEKYKAAGLTECTYPTCKIKNGQCLAFYNKLFPEWVDTRDS
jgi:hypothetical protein